ncbi:RluA family pseudouridine synthase [Alkaliphilus serpentinus]|uniref:Pseudouridine synthase n=1 Tax=Alkaliphilus serpentinus TaxID=1482731 RepID=A0A833HN42_9FIRM|nr:RluA family pseudouridine synthase [Alkaliphilus serpentinus]KAB3529051.1 RluA family pseudouridine synthase [Alkaliphilus serpentinus]
MLIKENQTETIMVYKTEREDDGKTIKSVLRSKLDFSSRLLTKLKHGEGVYLNQQYVKYHTLVKEGDIIQVDMEEPPNQFEPQDIPLNIVYEDVDLIIINKQPGIVSHPTKSHPNSTIANAAAYYLQSQGKTCRIRFVNRLDMDTSGLLIIAKNPYSHHVLSQMMQEDKIQKKYIAFVEGVVEDEEGTIDAPIYRPSDDSIRRIVDDRGQTSISKYKVLRRYKNSTVVLVELLTGRTHQIRVHMAYLGHPLIGDSLYNEGGTIKFSRQALHAAYLKLFQPRFREKIEVEAQLPEDLKKLGLHLENL